MMQLIFEYEPVASYEDDAKRELFCTRLPEKRAARIRSPRNIGMRAERAATEAAFRRACKRAGEVYANLTVAYSDDGKPYIEGRPDLSVSFSHTHTLGGVVLIKHPAGAPAVGMDLVESGTTPRYAEEIAARMFADIDRETADTPLSPEDGFLRAWSRFEARVKMTGEGIGGKLSNVKPQTLYTIEVSPAGIPKHYMSVAVDAKEVQI